MEEEAKKVEVQEGDLAGSSRASLYEKYEALATKKDGEKKAEPPAPKPVTAEEKEDAGEAPVKASAEPVKAAEPEKVVKEDYQKTVPLDALHQEREKRKTLASENKTLKQQLDTVLQDLKKLTEERGKVDTEPISDYETEIKTLKKELLSIKSDVGNFRKDSETEKSSRVMEDIREKLTRTNDELTKEGFPLFSEMQHLVSQEIIRLANDDLDNQTAILKQLDNPEGWKKIYREVVFPKLNTAFVPQKQEAAKDDKIEAKKAAKLSGSPGVKPEEEDKRGEWTYDDYLKSRKEKSLMGRTL